jgi:hypothetical protein
MIGMITQRLVLQVRSREPGGTDPSVQPTVPACEDDRDPAAADHRDGIAEPSIQIGDRERRLRTRFPGQVPEPSRSRHRPDGALFTGDVDPVTQDASAPVRSKKPYAPQPASAHLPTFTSIEYSIKRAERLCHSQAKASLLRTEADRFALIRVGHSGSDAARHGLRRVGFYRSASG